LTGKGQFTKKTDDLQALKADPTKKDGCLSAFDADGPIANTTLVGAVPYRPGCKKCKTAYIPGTFYAAAIVI
jgi:hypothetical protein